LRRAFPDAHVTIACSGYNAVVVEHSPDVDAVACLPHGVTPHNFGRHFRGVDQ
jgi:ADP-heptose:LPS heptosyltransferase